MVMNLFYRSVAILSFVSLLFACSGENNKDKKEDILSGEVAVLVDETILPIIEEQKEVFESSYQQAKINLLAKPEVNAVNSLLKGEANIILLTRELTEEENQSFVKRQIQPRIYGVAYDAVVFVAHVSADSLIKVSEVMEIMSGEKKTERKLAIDNPNSSLVRYLRDKGNLSKLGSTNIVVKGTVDSLLDAVGDNSNIIAMLSYNQYLSFTRLYAKKEKIRILSVLNDTLATPKYVKPSQTSLSTGEYPLKRELKILNYQPNMGLGMGFSAFLTGDRGQRIVLKSGLLPYTMPGREIIIRDINSLN
ncbi:substrate-binding domain-containing protein [Sphingobacterium thermophilum]|uniref:Substrate-binding domain-containing protein n=2 Tax=Sphingobacterium thermophilum TaxID=768534 RepID=A0ABP8R7A8_9SPHI